MKDPYVRQVSAVEPIDGDTFRCTVDLGFHVAVRMSCRIAGINAPEHDQPGGPEATTALAMLLGRGAVTITSLSVDKYAGRFDARVVVTDPARGGHAAESWDIGQTLIAQGHAVAWDGKGARPAVPWPIPTHAA